MKSKNRKRRSTRRPGPIRISETNPARSLREQEFQLNAIIEELEEVIAIHETEEKRGLEMRRRNIMPPPEYAQRHKRNREVRHYAERRHQKYDRNAGGLQFLFLLVIAAGLLFWLLYSGG